MPPTSVEALTMEAHAAQNAAKCAPNELPEAMLACVMHRGTMPDLRTLDMVEAYVRGSDAALPSSAKWGPAAHDVDACDSDGWTLLHGAISGRHVPAVRLLVSLGANVDAQCKDGRTPLLLVFSHVPVGEAARAPMVYALVSAGATLSIRPTRDRRALQETALMAACRQNDVEVASILLRAGGAGRGIPGVLHEAIEGPDWLSSFVSCFAPQARMADDAVSTLLAAATSEGHTALADLLRQHEVKHEVPEPRIAEPTEATEVAEVTVTPATTEALVPLTEADMGPTTADAEAASGGGAMSAVRRVLNSDELLGVLVSTLSIESRTACRRVCRSLHRVLSGPHAWRAVDLGHGMLPLTLEELSDHVIPRGACASLTMHLTIHANIDGQQSALRFPRLVELDISGTTLRREALQAALDCCGDTLLRLDLSSVSLWEITRSGRSGSASDLGDLPQLSRSPLGPSEECTARPIGWPSFKRLPLCFRRLGKLRTLVARDADAVATTPKPGQPRTVPYSWLALGAMAFCPQIEEVVLGWHSEHEAKDDPLALVTRSRPIRALPWLEEVEAEVGARRLASFGLDHPPASLPVRCPNLTSLTLAGYVSLRDTSLCFAGLHLVTLDLCGCAALTDGGLAAGLAPVGASLQDLNVSRTGFGDAAAEALVAAGARLARLAAAHTRLSSHGLAALSSATDRLTTLDLGHAMDCCRQADILAVARRHSTLTGIGAAGCADLTADGLLELLHVLLQGKDGTCSLEQLDISSCDALDSLAALEAILARCPGLTSLSASGHPALGGAEIGRLVDGLASLRYLELGDHLSPREADEEEMEIRLEETEEALGGDTPRRRRWGLLERACREGARVGEFFADGQVTRLGGEGAVHRYDDRVREGGPGGECCVM